MAVNYICSLLGYCFFIAKIQNKNPIEKNALLKKDIGFSGYINIYKSEELRNFLKQIHSSIWERSITIIL